MMKEAKRKVGESKRREEEARIREEEAIQREEEARQREAEARRREEAALEAQKRGEEAKALEKETRRREEEINIQSSSTRTRPGKSASILTCLKGSNQRCGQQRKTYDRHRQLCKLEIQCDNAQGPARHFSQNLEYNHKYQAVQATQPQDTGC